MTGSILDSGRDRRTGTCNPPVKTLVTDCGCLRRDGAGAGAVEGTDRGFSLVVEAVP